MLLGGPETSFAFGGGTAKTTFTCVIPCPVKENFLFWFSNIFYGIDVSAILEVFIERIFWHFSRGICDCVVSINTNIFCSCWDNISTFSALFEFFFSLSVNLFERTLFFGKFIFEFITFIFVAQSLVYGFISSNRHVSTWRGGGDKDNIKLVLYLCLI